MNVKERGIELINMINRGINFIDNDNDLVILSESYEAKYSLQNNGIFRNSKEVCISFELQTFSTKKYIKQLGDIDPDIFTDTDIRLDISDELKFILGSLGIFTLVKVNIDKRLDERDVLMLRDKIKNSLKKYIKSSVHSSLYREVPIVTILDLNNSNTSLFFIKNMLGSENINEQMFFIGDHGDNIVSLYNLFRYFTVRYDDYKYMSSVDYLTKEIRQLETLFSD